MLRGFRAGFFKVNNFMKPLKFTLIRKFAQAKIVIANKSKYAKKTIQKAQQYRDEFLAQKKSAASTTDS